MIEKIDEWDISLPGSLAASPGLRAALATLGGSIVYLTYAPSSMVR